MAFQPHTHSYALFLHEQYIFFCLESIHYKVSHEIEDPIQFLCILRIHDVLNQHLMCEMYMHEYFLSYDQTFNRVPFVGDVQLRAFTSYTINQVKWKAFDTFEENQATNSLVIQRENVQSIHIYNNHATFLQLEGCKAQMLAT